MKNQQQLQLEGLRQSFEAVPKLSLSAVCVEYGQNRFDVNWLQHYYPQLNNWNHCTKDFEGDVKINRRCWHYIHDCPEDFKKYRIAASKAGSHVARSNLWALDYGVTEETCRSRHKEDVWTRSLFDLLKHPHRVFDTHGNFELVSDLAIARSEGRASSLESLIMEDSIHLYGALEPKSGLDDRGLSEWAAFGAFAKVEDLALASLAAIDRLCNYDPDGNPWPEQIGAADRGVKKTSKKSQGRRGPNVKRDAKADKKLVEDWGAAKRNGSDRQRFCQSKNIKIKDLEDAQRAVKRAN